MHGSGVPVAGIGLPPLFQTAFAAAFARDSTCRGAELCMTPVDGPFSVARVVRRNEPWCVLLFTIALVLPPC